MVISIFHEGSTYNKYALFVDTSNIDTRQWFHLGIVYYTDPKLEAYINGVYVAHITGAYTDLADTLQNDGKMVIGRRYTGGDSDYCSMTVDDVKLFGRPLTGDEVARNYYATCC